MLNKINTVIIKHLRIILIFTGYEMTTGTNSKNIKTPRIQLLYQVKKGKKTKKKYLYSKIIKRILTGLILQENKIINYLNKTNA